jgi:hypothetical protein
MQWPLTTGAVVKLLSTREDSIRHLIRNRKVDPQQICGRRIWHPADVLAAAKLLGLDTVEVRNACSPQVSQAATERTVA